MLEANEKNKKNLRKEIKKYERNKIYKKKPKKVWKLKIYNWNRKKKTKTLNEFNSRVEETEERIRKLEKRTIA